jgi:hypothetical protein
MDTYQFVLATIVSTLFGSGIATAVVNQLFKRNLERELDRQRAFLQRQTKIHELQVETLMKIYSYLHAAYMHLQAFAAPVIDSQKAREPFFAAIDAAQSELIAHRLLIPTSLTDVMDTFFRKTLGGATDQFHGFNRVFPNPDSRTKYFTADGIRSNELYFDELHALLKLIETNARRLIRGDQ